MTAFFEFFKHYLFSFTKELFAQKKCILLNDFSVAFQKAWFKV